MKIGLVVSSNLYRNPFLRIYTKIFDANHIGYDIISWDREGLGEKESIVFEYPSPLKLSKFKKMVHHVKFSRFVVKIIEQNNYDRLIIFGSQVGLFMYRYLKKKYHKRFLFDYRDLSIEQQFMGLFKKLLDISAHQVISSPGFRKCLPSGYKYILSHNFTIDIVSDCLARTGQFRARRAGSPVVVSTIGGIRDYFANIEVIDSLKNDSDFYMRFIGKGISAEPLQEYASLNSVTNIEFLGYYPKAEEAMYIREADFMNIYYPKKTSHSAALSNRFYNALIYKKPMIVTAGGIQGDYVERYNLGLSLQDCSNLKSEIKNFESRMDIERFEANCNALLREFVEDYRSFEKMVLSFCSE